MSHKKINTPAKELRYILSPLGGECYAMRVFATTTQRTEGQNRSARTRSILPGRPAFTGNEIMACT